MVDVYKRQHKYRTAGSQVNGMLCEESCLCEILDRKVQRFCKGFDKGTTAGGTCLVELYIVNCMIFNTDTFHILTADVKDTVHIRVKELSSIITVSYTHLYLEIPAQVQSEEYYVNMMIAWFFATALAKQWDAAFPYIQEDRLSVWVHNKTIQKARESYRITDEQKQILKELKK